MRIGSDKDAATILGISGARLKAKISAGAPMPPFMKVPGSKFRRWDLDLVERWMAAFTVGAAADADTVLDPGMRVRGKRGLPKKIAEIGAGVRDV